MESRKEFRDMPPADIRLPREVYYRCLWTVRDMRRLEQLAGMLSGSFTGDAEGNLPEMRSIAQFSDDSAVVSDDTCERASFELECIRAAAGRVPEVYHEGLLDNIIDKTAFPDFAHPNTWKRWKLVFLHELAKELRLI